MKKLIGFSAAFILCVLFAAFNVPDRISLFFRGVSYYSEDSYDAEYSGMLPEGKLEIELASFDNEPIVVYQYEDVYLELQAVRVDESSYYLNVYSYGDFSCDSGRMLEPGIPLGKQTIETEKGTIAYELRGEGPGEKDGMMFTLGLSPADGSDIDLEEIGEMKLELPIYTWLKIFTRK